GGRVGHVSGVKRAGAESELPLSFRHPSNVAFPLLLRGVWRPPVRVQFPGFPEVILGGGIAEFFLQLGTRAVSATVAGIGGDGLVEFGYCLPGSRLLVVYHGGGKKSVSEIRFD